MNARIPQVPLPSQLVACIPDGLPVPELSVRPYLDELVTRYYVLNGVIEDEVVGRDMAAQDRARYAHLCTPGEIDQNALIDFMRLASSEPVMSGVDVPGIPFGWCVTWAYLDEFAQANSRVFIVPDLTHDEFVANLYQWALRKLGVIQ